MGLEFGRCHLSLRTVWAIHSGCPIRALQESFFNSDKVTREKKNHRNGNHVRVKLGRHFCSTRRGEDVTVLRERREEIDGSVWK